MNLKPTDSEVIQNNGGEPIDEVIDDHVHNVGETEIVSIPEPSEIKITGDIDVELQLISIDELIVKSSEVDDHATNDRETEIVSIPQPSEIKITGGIDVELEIVTMDETTKSSDDRDNIDGEAKIEIVPVPSEFEVRVNIDMETEIVLIDEPAAKSSEIADRENIDGQKEIELVPQPSENEVCVDIEVEVASTDEAVKKSSFESEAGENIDVDTATGSMDVEVSNPSESEGSENNDEEVEIAGVVPNQSELKQDKNQVVEAAVISTDDIIEKLSESEADGNAEIEITPMIAKSSESEADGNTEVETETVSINEIVPKSSESEVGGNLDKAAIASFVESKADDNEVDRCEISDGGTVNQDNEIVQQLIDDIIEKVWENENVGGHELTRVTLTKKTELPSRDDFYSDVVLRRKGYDLQCHNKVRYLMNLTLTVQPAQLVNCDVFVAGLPYETTENELVPLFEKVGQVYKVRIVDNSGMAVITYTTVEEAENAIAKLNGHKMRGRFITVRKYFPKVRLFVKPIPYSATKNEIFTKFNAITRGLLKVLLFNSTENESRNRGFCYLDYESTKAVLEAKRIISGRVMFGGQTMICDWPEKEPAITENTSNKLYLTNVHVGLRAADLRKYFSVYGEITETDKDGNFATVVFRNPSDAKRAAREIDKTKLGNENVEISDTRFALKKPHQRPTKQGIIGERYGPGKRIESGPATIVGPRKDNLIPNKSVVGSGRSSPRKDNITSNEKTRGPSQHEHDPRKGNMTSNEKTRGPLQHDPREDGVIPKSNVSGSAANERPGPRQNIIPINENTYGQGKDKMISKENGSSLTECSRKSIPSSKNEYFPASNNQYGSRPTMKPSNQNACASPSSQRRSSKKDDKISKGKPIVAAPSGSYRTREDSDENTFRSARLERYGYPKVNMLPSEDGGPDVASGFTTTDCHRMYISKEKTLGAVSTEQHGPTSTFGRATPKQYFSKNEI